MAGPSASVLLLSWLGVKNILSESHSIKKGRAMNGTPNPKIKVQFNLTVIPAVPPDRSLTTSQPAVNMISSTTPTVASAALPRLRTFALRDPMSWLTEKLPLSGYSERLNTPPMLNRKIKRILKHTYPQLRGWVCELSILIVLLRTRAPLLTGYENTRRT